jgi:hypothetical protein
VENPSKNQILKAQAARLPSTGKIAAHPSRKEAETILKNAPAQDVHSKNLTNLTGKGTRDHPEKKDHTATAEEIHRVHVKLLIENQIQAIHVHPEKTDQEAVLSNQVINRLEKEMEIRVEKENHLVTAEEVHTLQAVRGKLLTENQIRAIHVPQVKTDQEAVLLNQVINRLEKEKRDFRMKKDHSATVEKVHPHRLHAKHHTGNRIQGIHAQVTNLVAGHSTQTNLSRNESKDLRMKIAPKNRVNRLKREKKGNPHR